MAVASAGPYANLHIAPDKQPRQHPTTQFFTGRMPCLPPNQQHQSTIQYLLLKRPSRVVHGSILCDPIQPNPTHQLTEPSQTHYKWKNLDPTRPNPWVNRTHGQLCNQGLTRGFCHNVHIRNTRTCRTFLSKSLSCY